VKSKDGIATYISDLLRKFRDLFNKALNYRNSHITEVFEEFKVLNDKGGFVSAHWDGTAATEEKIRILQKLRLDVSLDSVEEAESAFLLVILQVEGCFEGILKKIFSPLLCTSKK
jgi:prolyl-tRNA synthetase